MAIHIGNRKTLRTRCGKPVARRWWVDDALAEGGRIGNLLVHRKVDPREGATCHKCLKGKP